MCKKLRKIYFVGIGMGSMDSLTEKARSVIADSDCVIGGKRMLQPWIESGKEYLIEYKKDVISEYLSKHEEYKKIAILLSGDVGFYSGAKSLEEEIQNKMPGQFSMVRIPGISSLVYLASALHMSWEDVSIVSLHGRNQNFIYEIQRNKKTFLLLGDPNHTEMVIQKLQYYGFSDCMIYIGRELSYPQETIFSKKVKDLKTEDLQGLCAAILVNENACKKVAEHLPDEMFERGKVPMTKEEVRTICIAKLRLTEDAVLYDVGAGTGSISIEAAMQSGMMRVYAIEKNPEGVKLIRENCRKMKIDHVQVIEGNAPKVLEGLEAPTHVFIGGSSGNLKEILQCVKAKNPSVKIVMTCISLNTMAEVMKAIESGDLRDPEIVQISVAKSKQVAHHHMMTGQNPIYIISEGVM